MSEESGAGAGQQRGARGAGLSLADLRAQRARGAEAAAARSSAAAGQLPPEPEPEPEPEPDPSEPDEGGAAGATSTWLGDVGVGTWCCPYCGSAWFRCTVDFASTSTRKPPDDVSAPLTQLARELRAERIEKERPVQAAGARLILAMLLHPRLSAPGPTSGWGEEMLALIAAHLQPVQQQGQYILNPLALMRQGLRIPDPHGPQFDWFRGDHLSRGGRVLRQMVMEGRVPVYRKDEHYKMLSSSEPGINLVAVYRAGRALLKRVHEAGADFTEVQEEPCTSLEEMFMHFSIASTGYPWPFPEPEQIWYVMMSVQGIRVEKLTADPARGKGCWRFEPPLVLKGMRVQLVQNDADPYA